MAGLRSLKPLARVVDAYRYVRRCKRARCVNAAAQNGPFEPALRQAAKQYAQAVEEGLDDEEVVAKALGAKDAKSLSLVQEQYKDKVRMQLAKKAAELKAKEQSAEGFIEFSQGKMCYERGRYPDAVRSLEAAINKADSFSQLGGDIQIWLALAYSACDRHEECVELFKALEQSHPVPAIRKQAASLCFIMEAPRLELSEDEKVNIPILSLDPNDSKKKGSFRRPAVQVKPKVKKTAEEEFWENYSPPRYLRNKYVWAATATLGIALAIYSSRL